jgi:hypothetical protein
MRKQLLTTCMEPDVWIAISDGKPPYVNILKTAAENRVVQDAIQRECSWVNARK